MTKSVAWAISTYCPNNCSHCGAGESTKDKDQLCLDDVKLIIDKLSDAGVKNITLGTGEPFLSKNIMDIVKYGNDKQIFFSFLTSGVGLTKDKLDQLLNANFLNQVQFSLDGDNRELNDSIRFKGSFDRVTSCLDYIKKNKKDSLLVVSVSNTLSKLTYNRIKEFCDFISNYDVHVVSFGYIQKIGKSSDNQWGIPSDKIKEIKNFVDKLSSKYSFSIYTPIKNSNIKTSCECKNNSVIFIDNKGHVFPCSEMLPGDHPHLNNAKKIFSEYPTYSLVSEEFSTILNGKLFNHFNHFVKEENSSRKSFKHCKKCDDNNKCFVCPFIIYNQKHENTKDKISSCTYLVE
jgi:MoaA/NifB/PqqE/SkfB family radical SAM enzyme